MDEFELTMTLSEFEVNVPDRCKSCPRLGALASRLSRAKDERDYIVTATNRDVLVANMRSLLTTQIKEHYPDATDEQIAQTVENSIDGYFSNENRLAAVLQQAGQELVLRDEMIETTLGSIMSLLNDCPPEGCSIDE